MENTVKTVQKSQPQDGNNPTPARGKFLVLEGGEGVGKSTQLQCLAAYLHGQNIPYLLTREPGGTPLAEQLRSAIVGEEVDEMEEMLMILAARRHHIRMVIQPALDSGMWVLCDRFIDSSLVYQGIVGGLDLDMIQMWHRMAGCLLVPDHTFVLQLDCVLARARCLANRLKSNKFDQRGVDFHRKIHKGYEEIVKKNPEHCTLVPAGGTPEEVTAALLDRARALFGLP
jgi:dTMP kinase